MGKQKCNCTCACATGRPGRVAKRWNAGFAKRHEKNSSNDPLFVDVLENIQVERELQDAFLQDTEISGSSWEVEQVQKFFREARSALVARIWMDYRVKNTKSSTSESRWLLSDDLARVMAQQASLPLMLF
jgi:hypothetical protein